MATDTPAAASGVLAPSGAGTARSGSSTAPPRTLPPGRRTPGRRRAARVRAVLPRYVALVAVLFLTVGPLLWQLSSSLKGRDESIFGTDATLLPQHPSLAAYVTVFQQVPMAQYVTNSLVICALSITSQLVLPTMAGYMLSRTGWKGAKVTYAVLIVSMIFPFESIMVSLFLMTQTMGLLDTLVGVWLPGAVSAVNVLIMRAAFSAVPQEVEEAALLDGAGEWQRFTRLFLPASVGALTVVVINSFISAWDDFLWPFIVLRSEDHFTLSLGLSRLAQGQLGYDPRVIMAGSMVAIIPIVVLFALCQRWFYRGVAEGAVK